MSLTENTARIAWVAQIDDFLIQIADFCNTGIDSDEERGKIRRKKGVSNLQTS